MAHDIETIARALVFHGEHVLICVNRKGGYGYLPGGHVEFGETAAHAVARELDEEAGLRAVVGECVLVHEHLFRQKGRLRHEINVVFHVELPDLDATPQRRSRDGGGGPPQITSREEYITFRWVPLHDLESMEIRPASIVPRLASLRGTGTTWMSDRADD